MLPEQSTQGQSQPFLLQSLRGQLCHRSGCKGLVFEAHQTRVPPPYLSQLGPA